MNSTPIIVNDVKTVPMMLHDVQVVVMKLNAAYNVITGDFDFDPADFSPDDFATN